MKSGVSSDKSSTGKDRTGKTTSMPLRRLEALAVQGLPSHQPAPAMPSPNRQGAVSSSSSSSTLTSSLTSGSPTPTSAPSSASSVSETTPTSKHHRSLASSGDEYVGESLMRTSSLKSKPIVYDDLSPPHIVSRSTSSQSTESQRSRNLSEPFKHASKFRSRSSTGKHGKHSRANRLSFLGSPPKNQEVPRSSSSHALSVKLTGNNRKPPSPYHVVSVGIGVGSGSGYSSARQGCSHPSSPLSVLLEEEDEGSVFHQSHPQSATIPASLSSNRLTSPVALGPRSYKEDELGSPGRTTISTIIRTPGLIVQVGQLCKQLSPLNLIDDTRDGVAGNVLLVGDPGIGLHSLWNCMYVTSEGVVLCDKIHVINTVETLQDLPSSIRLKTITVIFCFSVVSQQSLDSIAEKWIPAIKQYVHSPCCCFLVGTQNDLLNSQRPPPSICRRDLWKQLHEDGSLKAVPAKRISKAERKISEAFPNLFTPVRITFCSSLEPKVAGFLLLICLKLCEEYESETMLSTNSSSSGSSSSVSPLSPKTTLATSSAPLTGRFSPVTTTMQTIRKKAERTLPLKVLAGKGGDFSTSMEALERDRDSRYPRSSGSRLHSIGAQMSSPPHLSTPRSPRSPRGKSQLPSSSSPSPSPRGRQTTSPSESRLRKVSEQAEDG